MTNSGDLDKWLADNNVPLETYSGIMQSGSQLIFTCPTIEAFKKAVLDWEAPFSKEVVSKSNSGVGKFTYIIAGQTKGYAITISDTAAAPGVVIRMGIIEEILAVPGNLHAWFDGHPDLRAPTKDFIMAGLSVFLAYQTVITAKLPQEYISLSVPIFMAASWLLRYMQTHTTVPFIGARVPAPGSRKR